MNRDPEIGTKFFVGTEVEHTPAYGKKTLFVVGVQPISEIQDWLDDFANLEDSIEHIYFGANMSFPMLQNDDAEGWAAWENMINPFLEKGYHCTLDIDVRCVEGLCEGGLVEHFLFIPMISVKIPYINLLGYNATLKLDDKGFSATNPGVWCHSIHELKNRQVFTGWSKYSKDKEL
jgi:hypothetical protein